MRRYSLLRPLFLIITAYLMNMLVTNVTMLLGVKPEVASELGFAAMVATAIIVYLRMVKRKPPQ